MKRSVLAIALAVTCVAPMPVEAAANKEHQQLMAEIRMLQEQQQQLQQMLGGLADTLKMVTAKLTDEAGITRKAFADQNLVINSVGDTMRILREKADDTNVRLSSMTQEMEALRQAVASMPPPATASVPAGDPAAGDPGAATPPGTGATNPPAATSGPPPNVSPTRMYDNAFADYTGGHYDLAVLGFETYIKMFPRTDRADDAQLNIGNSLFAEGKYAEAVTAFQKVISDYPQSDTVPAAYYKLGLSYEGLRRVDLARKAYDTVIAKYPPTTTEVTLARQALERLNRAKLEQAP